MKLKQKQEEQSDSEEETKDNFSDKLDIMRFVAEIKLRLKKDITADFVLARLEKKDKEAIIEMTSNAYYAQKLILILARRSKEHIWDEDKGKYKHVNISDDKKRYLIQLSNAIFDSYMTRIYMTVVLNRNIDGNYLVNVLSGYKDEEQDIDLTPEEAKDQLKSLLGNEETKNKSKEK